MPTLFSKTNKNGFPNVIKAALNANDPTETNVFLTGEDLNKDGVSFVILNAPNGTKWKVSVNNSGALITAAV